VLDLLQHAAFVVCMLDLLHFDDLGLLQHLDGVETLVVLGLHKVHTPEATGAEGALDGKVLQRVLALCDAHLGLRVRLRGLHAAICGLGGGLLRLVLVVRGVGVGGRVYQVLYARDSVRGLLVGLWGGLRGRVGLLRVRRGVHRVGGLVGRRLLGLRALGLRLWLRLVRG